MDSARPTRRMVAGSCLCVPTSDPASVDAGGGPLWRMGPTADSYTCCAIRLAAGSAAKPRIGSRFPRTAGRYVRRGAGVARVEAGEITAPDELATSADWECC